ncbi:anti-sigma-I factor RsgI8-like [Osmerus eperlanus]|uniref:anti-sigma-I factor RsgI8-like n=1 Tax=Osmerus eperlanus TaxID=29151 RepID=UPI002E0D53DA
MRLHGGVVCGSGLVCAAMLVIIFLRRKEEDELQTKVQFQLVKLQMTGDILMENQHEIIRIHNLLDKSNAQMNVLDPEVSQVKATEEIWKKKLETCTGEKKNMADEVEFIKSQQAEVFAEFEKETSVWKVEVNSLQKQMTQHSKLCNFVRGDSDEARKLCGTVVPKENPKELEVKEAPQPEAPQPDAPQPEAPKPDAPKPDTPKPDAPKP